MNTHDHRAQPGSHRGTKLLFAAAAAAATILFLFATNARAGIVYFEVVESQSWLQQTRKLVGPALGGSKIGVPQELGSDKTHFFGDMYVDIVHNFQGTTIQLLPAAYISARVTGDYAPHDYVFQNPPGAPYPVGVTPNANYGWSLPAIGGSIAQYNLRIDNGAPGIGYPSTPMELVGDRFNLSGQAMSFTDGREAFLSALTPENETKSLVGEPFFFFGTAASDIGTWNGYSLTIPVHSSFSRVITTDFGGISEFVDVTGQLVLVTPVPEPSTMMLMALGIVALLGRSWHARKRRSGSGS